MNKQIIFRCVLLFAFFASTVIAQNNEAKENQLALLFDDYSTMSVRMACSFRDIKKNTNDSTYVDATLNYLINEKWDSLNIGLRRRGNFRLENCYFTPLKIKIKKKDARGTIFKGHKRLKLVLPCLQTQGNNDELVREYLAYRLFEIYSAYHFKTRMLDLDLAEIRGKKVKQHKIKAFLIEDDKVVAKRHDGRVMQNKVHPLAQDTLSSVRNAFFQYMIGNTDYSVKVGHNEKLLFINKEVLPVPYDFDMSGFVNASYARVSQVGNSKLPIENVTQRLYRGIERSPQIFEMVRQEFIAKKEDAINLIKEHKSFFVSQSEYNDALDYIQSFYKVLLNDRKFKNEIVDMARKI